mmetsp:Transcript_15621/g.29201  ORF Transcript_15621/g.29201 Transcript_15621/m.29201 type:complete len:261 (-) Transcript_15621:434-1216(-)
MTFSKSLLVFPASSALFHCFAQFSSSFILSKTQHKPSSHPVTVTPDASARCFFSFSSSFLTNFFTLLFFMDSSPLMPWFRNLSEAYPMSSSSAFISAKLAASFSSLTLSSSVTSTFTLFRIKSDSFKSCVLVKASTSSSFIILSIVDLCIFQFLTAAVNPRLSFWYCIPCKPTAPLFSVSKFVLLISTAKRTMKRTAKVMFMYAKTTPMLYACLCWKVPKRARQFPQTVMSILMPSAVEKRFSFLKIREGSLIIGLAKRK